MAGLRHPVVFLWWCLFSFLVTPQSWDGPRVRVNEREVPASRASALQQPRNVLQAYVAHSPGRGAWRLQTRGRIFCLYAVSGPHPWSTVKRREKVRNPCTDDTASRGGSRRDSCGNARVLAFCARRELARGLCARSCLGSRLRGLVLLSPELVHQGFTKRTLTNNKGNLLSRW